VIDWTEFVELRAEGFWVGIRVLIDGFYVAAGQHPWTWLVLVLIVLMATKRAWARLFRFMGGAFLRQVSDS
tara:strand:+ start:16128 stop:16340 length:213 start_codon:yes stop_codon:yes gene_type:complete